MLQVVPVLNEDRLVKAVSIWKKGTYVRNLAWLVPIIAALGAVGLPTIFCKSAQGNEKIFVADLAGEDPNAEDILNLCRRENVFGFADEVAGGVLGVVSWALLGRPPAC